MMTVSQFVRKLKEVFPDIKFFNGAIDKKNAMCVGVYARGSVSPVKAVGGQSSYNTIPIRLLVRWTEDSDLCEIAANALYSGLDLARDWVVGGRRVININLLDSHPIDLSRDERNVCEMVIRLNVTYEREVM